MSDSFMIVKELMNIGKDLKGKELGKGICQRKDGKYTARFVSKNKKIF